MMITGQGMDAARKTWRNMRNDYTDVAAMRHCYQFDGIGQRPTPVIDARGVVIIINFLPGAHAAGIKAACADVARRFYGGDLSLIPEIERNRLSL
jgi:hypothetical protein